jgi:hypothetical protein
VLTSFTCISRNNPWDPINGCSDANKAEYRRDVEESISISLARTQSSMQKFDQFLEGFTIGSQRADSLLNVNDSIRSTLDQISLNNTALRWSNNSLACSLTTTLDTFRLLDTLKLYFPDSITQLSEIFRFDSLLVVSEIETGNNRCSPSGIFTGKQRENLCQPLVEFSHKQYSLTQIQDNYNKKFGDMNLSIEEANDSLSLLNAGIKKYNDSIMTSKLFCKKNPVVNVDTLKKRPLTIKPGDTLFIGAGTFTNSDFKFSYKGDSLKTIVVMGSPFMNTVFDGISFVVSASKNIIFENLIIQNSKDSSGVRLEGFCENITFRNCIMRNNSKCGIQASVSYLDLVNCQIYGNKQDGIYLERGQTAIPRLIGFNLLIVRNGHFGINSLNSGIKIEKTTICDNDGGGINLNDPEDQSFFSFVNVSFNKNFGIYKTPTQKPMGTVYFSGCNFYENSNRDIEVSGKYIESKEEPLAENPLFIDRAAMNYRIAPESAIYNLQIGYEYSK